MEQGEIENAVGWREGFLGSHLNWLTEGKLCKTVVSCEGSHMLARPQKGYMKKKVSLLVFQLRGGF